MADLGKLKRVFKKDGTTAAGNSRQMSDGSGVVLLNKGIVDMQKGLSILGAFRNQVFPVIDESNSTCRKKLSSIGLDNTKMNKQVIDNS